MVATWLAPSSANFVARYLLTNPGPLFVRRYVGRPYEISL